MRASRRRLASAAALALAAAATAPVVHAKEEFPGEIAGELGLDYSPPCRVCHIQGTTGAGSVATPFAISMLAHGMTGSGSSLPSALEALRTDGTDSDGDGKPDVDELRADTDPNTPVDVPLVSEDPRYGCSVVGDDTSSRAQDIALALLLFGGMLLAVRVARATHAKREARRWS